MEFWAILRTFLLYSAVLSRNYTLASMLAGELIFGSLSMDITETRMASTFRIGLHFSSALSCSFIESAPGACRIEIHTLPSG